MGTILRTLGDLNNHTRSMLVLSQAESIIGDNTYRSPGTYVTELDPSLTENINYSGGSATYTGAETIQITIDSRISVSSASAGTNIYITSGIKDTPSVEQEVYNKLTNANDTKELSHQGTFTISQGDTIDFFIKASANVVLEKAVWRIKRYN